MNRPQKIADHLGARWEGLTDPQRAQLRTAGAVAVALLCLWVLWWHYMLSPWTRDGRVRAEVVKIAPEVFGTVVSVKVADNQLVHRGDVLFVIDPVRFQLAVDQAEAAVAQRAADKKAKDYQATRRIDLLKGHAVSEDEVQSYQGIADVADAAYAQAVADREVARLNQERSVLRSPVNGYVTNLTLREGDFVNSGIPQLSIVDSDSFYILGYFEETKLRRIRDGARAEVRLMQGGPALDAHVEGISRGITDVNGAAGELGLANVNPVFTWVRLAQRIPVRFHIDRIPPHTRVAAGLTCTVSVDEWGRVVAPDAAP
jgi:multidrug resistance efflux pump